MRASLVPNDQVTDLKPFQSDNLNRRTAAYGVYSSIYSTYIYVHLGRKVCRNFRKLKDARFITQISFNILMKQSKSLLF